MQEDEKKMENETEPNVILKVTASAFPMRLFNEWDANCKERFGDCRWMKMWNDHMAAKNVEMYIELNNQLIELRKRVELLEKEPETKKSKQDGVRTFKGIVKEEDEDEQ